MSRLIYADDLPVSSVDFTDVEYYIKKYGTGIPVVYMEDINDAPTIDAVEVVRCKDCKYKNSHIYKNAYTCDRFKGNVFIVDDDYCSYAERRNE